MKNAIKMLPKRMIAGLSVFIAVVLLSASSLMAATVRLEGSLGIANVTDGDTSYEESVNASYDDVLKVQVYYHNMEDPTSDKVANDLRLKIDVPTEAGKKQTIKGTLSSPDSNTVTDTVIANLDREDAYIEYIPGSAVWKHNIGTNENVNIVEETISDEVVYGNQGLILEDAKPCFNFDATVTILVRVKVPGIKVTKKTRVAGQTEWTTSNSAKPGDKVQYMIEYKNEGNTTHEDVLIRDNLPPKIDYVAGSTKLANQNGTRSVADGVTTTGIVTGDYGPGANAFVMFEAMIPEASELECGITTFRNVGIAKPKGMNEYYNTATTSVEKKCDTPDKPGYVCESLSVEKLGGRKVKATVIVATSGDAQFKSVTFNYGDGSTPKTTSSKSDEYTYAKDGTYIITTKVVFTVEGKDRVVEDVACTKSVTFKSGEPTPEPELPSTGAGSIVGLFAATSAFGAAAHSVISRRRNQ